MTPAEIGILMHRATHTRGGEGQPRRIGRTGSTAAGDSLQIQ